jgi:hypothetical protein
MSGTSVIVSVFESVTFPPFLSLHVFSLCNPFHLLLYCSVDTADSLLQDGNLARTGQRYCSCPPTSALGGWVPIILTGLAPLPSTLKD